MRVVATATASLRNVVGAAGNTSAATDHAAKAALAACADNEVYGKPVPASVRQDIKRLNYGFETDQVAP